MAFLESNPDEAVAIMAGQAGITPAEYGELEAGTRILGAEEALAAFTDDDAPTSLPATSREINPFLVESGPTDTEADLAGLFAPRFTRAIVDGDGT